MVQSSVTMLFLVLLSVLSLVPFSLVSLNLHAQACFTCGLKHSKIFSTLAC